MRKKTTLKSAMLLIMLASCFLAGNAWSSLYIYIGPDGTRWISDQPMRDRGFRLLKRYTPGRSLNSSALPCDAPGSSRIQRRLRHYHHTIQRYARRYGVDAALVKAVIHAESCYDPNAVSRSGAVGLMQLMPDTARRYGVTNSHNPQQNILGGVRYLSDLKKMFRNNRRLVLAAYNAGENNVIKYGGVPPFPETQNYVPKVMRFYRFYRKSL